MNSTARRSAAAITAVAAAGVSSVFLGAAPASAAPAPICGPSGTIAAAGICEQTFTASGTFTPTPAMSTLEVLLVGAGGNGVYSSTGYSAGGGGDVKVVDFSAATTDLTITVPSSGSPTTVVSGAINASAANGQNGSDVTSIGGASGNPANTGAGSNGGGGGAGGSAVAQNGGAGLVVNTLVAGTSLFANDTTCYGGGGASGSGTAAAGCGGGYPDDPNNVALVAPTANHGGGGGALPVLGSGVPTTVGPGAVGVVVVRWNAPTVTVTFDANGHGTAPAAETVPGGATVTRPADPTATGFRFDGWFTDASLTTLADFSAGAVGDTTFFAKWTPVLAPTGVTVNPGIVSGSVAAVALGATLLLVRARRRRLED